MMKIYAIDFEYCNGQDYECAAHDSLYIGFYSTYELALKAFTNLDPEKLLHEQCCMMLSDDIGKYRFEQYTNKHTDRLVYSYSLEYDDDCGFIYEIVEIDVLESLEEGEKVEESNS